MKKLYKLVYYYVSFMPKQTINDRMRGNEHHMTNKQLYDMRAKQVFKLLTFRNVIIYKTYKLKQWLTKKWFH